MTRARDLASGLNGIRPFATATLTFSVPVIAAGNVNTPTITYPAGRFTVAPVYAVTSGEGRVTIGFTGTPSASSIILVLFNSTSAASSATTGQLIATQLTPTSATG